MPFYGLEGFRFDLFWLINSVRQIYERFQSKYILFRVSIKYIEKQNVGFLVPETITFVIT